jgi:hypothetical protein
MMMMIPERPRKSKRKVFFPSTPSINQSINQSISPFSQFPKPQNLSYGMFSSFVHNNSHYKTTLLLSPILSLCRMHLPGAARTATEHQKRKKKNTPPQEMPLRIHTAVAPNPTLIIIPRCNSPNSHAHLHDEQIVCVLKKAPVLKSSEQNKKTEPPMSLPNPFFSVVTIAADLIGTQKLGLRF